MTIHNNMGIKRINPVFSFDVRPHPGPLPQERENPSAALKAKRLDS
jgi:hypothetical protein